MRRLVRGGYREIVLTGIHLGHYGVDRNRTVAKSEWTRLSDLVRDIAAIDGDFRIRLSSIEATEVTRDLIRVIADHPDKVCPHLHVCMQSGSDAVLRRMRRRWGKKRFIDRCHLIKDHLDDPALTTDIIVGFPGETDQDFEASCAVAREIGFSKIHIFPFSPRQGTPAAEMQDQVPSPVRSERGRELARVETELRDAYLRRLVGKRLTALVESPVRGQANQVVGTACRYAPIQLASSRRRCSLGIWSLFAPRKPQPDRLLALAENMVSPQPL